MSSLVEHCQPSDGKRPVALSIHNLYKTYGRRVDALKNLNLEVEQGDFFALLGPNGAGKTTLISILCSIVVKTKGTVKISGIDIERDFATAKSKLGVVPQEFNFNPFEKVLDIIVNEAGFYGISRKVAISRTQKYLKELGLWEKRHSVSRYLSGGMKRRLMIARALVHQPEILILDEPTAGVDIELRQTLWDFLRRINNQGITIILTTHYLEEAENLCRNIAIIDHGEIITHTTMTDLLKTLDHEVFMLESLNPLPKGLVLGSYSFVRVDDDTLEVTVNKEDSLNPIFQLLSEQGISIVTMRNKMNRLEQLFLTLTNGKNNRE